MGFTVVRPRGRNADATPGYGPCRMARQRLIGGGQCTVFRAQTNHTNGLGFNSEGRL
jgi:hypothetical protein